MKIEKLPASCIGARVPYFIKFSYEGKIYDKAVRGDFCDKHRLGELIEMKMLGGSDKILFPRESAMLSLVSFGILSISGLLLALSQLNVKKRNL